MQDIWKSEEKAIESMLSKQMEELDKIIEKVTVDCHGTLRFKFDVLKMTMLQYTSESIFQRIIPPLLFYYCIPMSFTSRCFVEKGKNESGYDRIFLNVILFSDDNDPDDHTGECDITGTVFGKYIRFSSLNDAIRFAKAVKNYQNESVVSYLFKKDNTYYILFYIFCDQIQCISYEFGDLCEMMPQDIGECIICEGDAIKKLSIL